MTRRTGLGIAGFGILIWAVTLVTWSGYSLAAPTAPSWLQELRQGAILLATLGFVLALPEVLPAAVPAVALFGALMSADIVLDRARPYGLPALLGAVVLGIGLTGVAWQLARLLGADRAIVYSGQRRYLAVAVVAAFCAPALATQGPSAVYPPGLREALPATTALVAAALGGLAGYAALAAGPPVRFAPAIVAIPVVLLAAVGTLTGSQVHHLRWAALGAPLAAAAVAVARRTRAPGRWVALGAAAAVAGLPLAYLAALPGFIVGVWFLRTAGHGDAVGGLPYLPGAILLALVLAVALPGRGSAERQGDEPQRATLPAPEGTS